MALDTAEDEPHNVYTVELASSDLKEIPKSISQYVNCKSLDLSCNFIRVIKDRDLTVLKDLRELKVYANQLQSISGLQKLVKLERLQLQFNRISSIGSSLKSNRNLTFLRLDSNKFRFFKAEELCSLAQLTYLDVSSNMLDNIDCFNVLSALQELHCTHNKLQRLPPLRSLKKLREVDFSHNQLTDISGLKSLPSLSVLSLEHNCLADISSVGMLKSLQDLRLKGNSFTDTKHIAIQFPNLELLDISWNKLGKHESIEPVVKLNFLNELSVEGNSVVTASSEDKGKLIKFVQQNSKIQVLDGHNIISCPKRPSSHAMRPMSASQAVSTRLLEDQIFAPDLQLVALEEKISSGFKDVQEKLKLLPAERPRSAKPAITDSAQADGRPSSRCSRRSRIADARVFASQHFDSGS